MSVEHLRTAGGAAALAAAERLLAEHPADPLAAATALRVQGVPPDLAAAALTQARLRSRARGKFGDDASRLHLTPGGLQQATRPVVAERRAHRLAAAGARHVADLGCGIGADTIAFARAGLRVLAIDIDPETAECARANIEGLGLGASVEVRCADATTVDLSDVDAVFCDPARRSTATGRRVFDPAAYSPAWDFVRQLPRRVPATVLKVAPGIGHALVPAGAEAEWVSVDGDVVEAAFWCGPLAEVARRATILRSGRPHELAGTGADEAPTGPLGRFLFDPDGAIVRSHLVAEFAQTVGGHIADPHIAYVFADRAAPTPYAACFEVLERLAYGLKRLRADLRSRGIGRLEIRKRGLSVDPDQLRRDLRLAGERSATLVLARFADGPTALLCAPIR